MTSIDLPVLVRDLAEAIAAVDARGLSASSSRKTGRTYKPGIGPFSENEAIRMAAEELKSNYGDQYKVLDLDVRYPDSRQKCDLTLGSGPDWAVEVKLARIRRDNGTIEDAAVKKVLSPYPPDRSAVTDCLKLVNSSFSGRLEVVIYGFEDSEYSLDYLIDAFEVLAPLQVSLGPRHSAATGALMHPVFAQGRVLGWEIWAKDA